VIARYTREEMGALWTDEARYRAWLAVEVAVTDALARRGFVPREDVEAIHAKLEDAIDPARIAAIEAEVKHDVIAFVTSVAEKIGAAGRHLHFGLTSSDVVDTALASTLVRASDVLLAGIDRLLTVLERQARTHKDTVMVGRTHGIHAEPYTLGLKFVSWHLEARRNRERLAAAREEVRTGKLSGAVGTYAHLDPGVEAEVLAVLGLRPEPLATQVIPRDRHAAYVAALGILASSLDRIATEIRHLQRTDVREVEEPFAKGQKGSSAMPHKRNPIGCENVSGLARLVRSYVQAALENVPLWHERDISHSSVERVALPDATILCDFMLHRMTGILDGLLVYPDRMAENLARMKGLVFSQAVLLALNGAGLPRERAYEIVQRSAMRVWEGAGGLQDLLRADPDVRAVLSEDALAACFDAHRTLRHVDPIYERAFSKPS
jgi:adenylosuccinate lyase